MYPVAEQFSEGSSKENDKWQIGKAASLFIF